MADRERKPNHGAMPMGGPGRGPGRGGPTRGAKPMKLDKNSRKTLSRLFGIIFQNYKFHFLVVIILDEAHIAPTFGQWQPLRVGSFIFYQK